MSINVQFPVLGREFAAAKPIAIGP
jgi:hypothetical protein